MSEWERSIGKKIRDARRRAGMSQERLAEIAGIASGYVSQIENGKKTPSAKAVSRISEALNLDMADFLMRDREIPSASNMWIAKITDLLADRSEEEVRMAYNVLRAIFERKNP